MKSWTVLGTLAILTCLAGLCLAQDKKGSAKSTPSNHEHLKPLAYFIGDWDLSGEIHVAGQPPINFSFQRHWGWTLGGNFIETSTTEAEAGRTLLRHKSIIGWEPKTTRITEWGFWSHPVPNQVGTWSEIVTWAKDGKTWVIERDKVRGVFTVIDQDSHKYECKFRGDDGSDNSWHYTAKRRGKAKPPMAKQPAMPADIAKELGYYVGDWTLEGSQSGKAVKGRWSARWSPQKQCMLLSAILIMDGEEVHGTGITGWDSSKGEVVTRTFFTNGVVEDIRYKLASPGVLKGVHSVSAKGELSKADCEVRAKQPNEWTFTSKASALADKGQGEVSLRFVRSKAQPQKGRAK